MIRATLLLAFAMLTGCDTGPTCPQPVAAYAVTDARWQALIDQGWHGHDDGQEALHAPNC